MEGCGVEALGVVEHFTVGQSNHIRAGLIERLAQSVADRGVGVVDDILCDLVPLKIWKASFLSNTAHTLTFIREHVNLIRVCFFELHFI